MTIAIADLIAELQVFAPIGVELPRDPTNNNTLDATIQRWAEDAAQKINERRGKTTLKETTITMVADTVDYDLPAGAREVKEILRRHATVHSATVLGIEGQGLALGLGPFGTLPSGQEITPAMDAIQRQRIALTVREDSFELWEGQIRMLFPIEVGEEIVVRYWVIDRTLEAVSDDRFSLILTYLQWQNLEWYLGKHGAGIVQSGDSLGQDSFPVLTRNTRELENKWISGLNAIGREAN